MMRFLRYIIFIVLVAACHTESVAQVFVHHPPLYIVNGKPMSEADVKRINPDDIATNVLLPADEENIAKYGQQASHGVILITLRYDTPARFMLDGEPEQIADYIAQRIKWEYPARPVARVVLRLKIAPDGKVILDEVLEASDKRLLKRVEKVVTELPHWHPATKDGKGVESEYILRMTLPQGMSLPKERSVPIIIGGA